MSRWYLPMLSIVALACCASVSVPALAQTKGSDSIGDTVRMVRNGSLRERLEALERVSQLRDVRQIGEWKIVSLLRELASGDNPRIARRAVEAMGDLVLGADRTLKEEVRSPLLKLLNDAQLAPLVRAAAALQLGLILTAGDFADAQAVAALVASGKAGGGTPEVAAAAILALGEIGDPKGKDAIRAGLSATEQVVKEAAIEALGKFLAGKDADKIMDASLVPLLMRLLSDPGIGPDAKERILESVGRAGGAGAEAAIVHVLETEDKPSTVLAALRALGFVGGAKAATALVTTFEKFDIK